MMADDSRRIAAKAKLVPVFVSKSEAPKGAIRMTEKEILTLQLKRLEKCKTSEKSAFRFGPHIAGGSTAITACILNAHFRAKFLLFDYGLIVSYAPSVIVPTMMSLVINELLTRQVLLQPDCMGCLEVRSGIFQMASSVLYTSIIAPVSSIALAKKYHTYLIKNNFQPGVKHALKTTPFNRFCFIALLIHNLGVGAALRYEQGQQLENIVAKEPVAVTRELLEHLSD